MSRADAALVPATASAPRADGWWLGLIAAVAYFGLRQHTTYGDGSGILLHNAQSEPFPGYHPLCLVLLRLCHLGLAPLHVSLHDAGLLLGATGAGAGVALSHAASRALGMSRECALRVAAQVATCPALVFFATVVELHAPFFAFAGLSFVATARAIDRPTLVSGVVLGLATGAAYLAHATAAVLPAALALVAAGELRQRRRAGELAAGQGLPRSLLRLGFGIALAHGALMLFGLDLLRALGLPIGPTGAAQFAAQQLGIDTPRHAAALVVQEWLVPFLPLSVVSVVALAVPASRWLAAAVLLCTLLYLVLAYAILGGIWNERGAYLLPLAWPLAWLGVRAVPARVGWLSVPVGLGVALVLIDAHDDPQRSLAYVEGVRAAAGDREPLLLIGDSSDIEALFVRMPEAPFLSIVSLAAHPPAVVARGLPELDRYLRDQIECERRAVLLTAGAEQWLRSPRAAGSGAALALDYLERHFSLQPVNSGRFHGKRIELR